jgi:hypothetical protein
MSRILSLNWRAAARNAPDHARYRDTIYFVDCRPRILHNVGIVMSFYAKLAIICVLLAACAFVVDVLSPVTPTPTAQLAKAFVLGLFLPVLVAFAGPFTESLLRHTIFPEFPTTAKPNSRLLLTLICLLLF